jgi:hypothetical protein
VDFVVDAGGRLELFEAKWTELPDAGDAVNLEFVRNAVGKSKVTGGAVVSRTPNSFPLSKRIPGDSCDRPRMRQAVSSQANTP